MLDREALRAELARISDDFAACSMRLRLPAIVASELTLQQLKVMSLLFWATPAPRPHDVALALGITPATVSGIVARLVEQDLVSQMPDPDDKRSRRLQLTAAGERALAELNDIQTAHRRAAEDQMTDEELAGLLVGIEGFVRGLRAQESDDL